MFWTSSNSLAFCSAIDNLRGERLQALLVLGGERTAALVQHLGHADGLARLADHGDAQDRAGEEAGAPVELGVEPQVGVGVRDVDALAGGEHRAGDAGVFGNRISHSRPCQRSSDHSSRVFSSFRKRVDRSAFSIRVASPMTFCKSDPSLMSEVISDTVDELELLLPHALDPLDDLRALQRDRALRRHLLEQREVALIEAPVQLVEHLDNPDRLAPHRLYRRAKDRPRRKASRLVYLVCEAGVGVGVENDLAYPALIDDADNATVVHDSNLVRPLIGRPLGVQLADAIVVQKQ